ncbi:MAG: hypothetical protein AAGI68_08440 [Planctomycetota bacterium]
MPDATPPPPNAIQPEPVTLPPNASNHDWLQAFLDHHPSNCPSCNYDLKGLQSDRCPECGEPLVLAVHVEQPALAAFITTVIFLTPPALFGVFSLLFVAPNLNGLPLSAVPCLVLSYFVLAVPALFILLAKRRAFLRLPTATQAWLAFIPISIDVILVLMLFGLAHY